MNFTLIDNSLTAADWVAFRAMAGWGSLTLEQAERGIANSIFTVTAVKDEKVIGIGRLVGDGAVIWYVQDIIVLPEYRGMGVGSAVVARLVAYARGNSIPGTGMTIGLMSAVGREGFYEKFGFHTRPNDHEGAGMVMRVKVEEK